jgi:sialate O-acetylesterase
MKKFRLPGVAISFLFVLRPFVANADVKLPAMFSDHAVLQRDMPVPVWGWAEPGEEVTVSIAGQTHKATADDKGKWSVKLDPLSVGDPLTLVVEGKNRLERKDILVGEVWVCSGQSNMEWKVADSTNSDLEVTAANHPNIRVITITGLGSQTPVEDCNGKWERVTPDTIKDFSAVGYYFGRELEDHIGVPIGLIDNSWGGSACDAWVPREKFAGNPVFQPMLDRWAKIEADWDEDKARADHKKKLAEWQKKADAAKESGEPAPKGWPGEFRNPMTGNSRPGNLFHARLGPVIPYAIRGVIWYQGESNATRAYQYREMFPLMISSWREAWGQGDFPFYWVQLADYMAEQSEPGDSEWAELREAQTLTQDKLPNTGQAVIINLGEAADIHPRNKLEVAKRLARWALGKNYGEDVVVASPRYESMEREGDEIIVKFKDVDGGLRTVDNFDLKGFAIAGEDRKWVWADAKLLDKERVEVHSDKVANPVAVRYAWADNPVCNLYSWGGLPATPFRTDDWPGKTVDER